ncbi:nucleoid-structuring protein H-NS [Mycobacterium eburneum]|nr:nucleoid-structuring protein H-NS [Mycobacterium eburneum]TDH47524.1 nucleoid-structuring protein H-NS [Mycobacterium eburneum]
MADSQDQPDHGPDAAPEPPEPQVPSDKPAPEQDAEPPAKKAPAKKAPAKAAKKAPAKKAPAKKAPAKKAPAKKAPAKKAAPGIDTNGSAELAAAAKETAAQAKSAVDAADNPVARPAALPAPASGGFPVTPVVAAAIGLLVLLLIRQLVRRAGDDA